MSVREPAASLAAGPGATAPRSASPVRDVFWARVGPLLPGVAASLGVGLVASLLSGLVPAVSPLIGAVVLGAVLANTGVLPGRLAPGIGFSAKQLLRLAVGLLGVRLALPQVLELGPTGLWVVLAAVGGTFLFAVWVGRRAGLPHRLNVVLAAGTSVCGAAAVVAISGAVDAKEEDTAVGVGAVTLFGTLAMLLYPVLGRLLGLTATEFGLWAGGSIHEVAQVVAAAFSFGSATGTPGAVELATVVKLGRVLMLAPMALLLAALFRGARAGNRGNRVPLVPWFVVLFLACVAVRSSGVLPPGVVDGLVKADTLLLAVAMAGLGLELKGSRLRAAGFKPFWVVGASTAFIGAGTFALAAFLAR